MNEDRKKIYSLINNYFKKNYNTWDFCSEFTRLFDLDIDINNLTEKERKFFSELAIMTARFSDVPEDLKIPNLYFNESQINNKLEEIIKELDLKFE